MRLPKEARVLHNSVDDERKDAQRRFQLAAFKPEGPGDPSVLSAVERISSESRESKTIGWKSFIAEEING